MYKNALESVRSLVYVFAPENGLQATRNYYIDIFQLPSLENWRHFLSLPYITIFSRALYFSEFSE